MLKGYRKLPETESFGVLFGRLVRAKRGIEGLSQDGLAGRTELSKARISDLETGKTKAPRASTIDALCVALNISPEEQAACHSPAGPRLPPRLLENLALRFGHGNPQAQEDELEAFLKEKAAEFVQMQSHLAQITQTEGRIAQFLDAANRALEDGDFQLADARLAEAEDDQLQSMTLAALDRQSDLRFARGHAALLAGDIDIAAAHWEAAANSFHFLDTTVEAEKRYAACDDLRAYGYRYRSVPALQAAKDGLQRNLKIWTKSQSLHNWCRATNALGGASWRLSQFDVPDRFLVHATSARVAYEAVRETCSETILPYYYALSGGNLASLYADRALSNSDEEFRDSLALGLEIQQSALNALSQTDRPVEWGIFQHNIGNAYTQFFKLHADKLVAVHLVDSAIDHLQRSFEVRDPVDMLQYWIASRRSLGEALIEKSLCQPTDEAVRSLQQARELLTEATFKISRTEHPHQWAELHNQLSRCSLQRG